MMPPRCRSVGGKVYDLQATERKPPCARGASKVDSKPPPAVEKKHAPRAKPTRRKPGLDAFGGVTRGKPRPLPPPITGELNVGDRVSVLSYGSEEVDHATVIALPNPTAASIYERSTEPTVLFVNGEVQGMKRHIPVRRMRAGWLEPRTGWKPWKD